MFVKSFNKLFCNFFEWKVIIIIKVYGIIKIKVIFYWDKYLLFLKIDMLIGRLWLL